MTDNTFELDPTRLPPPVVERLSNAVVLPMEPEAHCANGVVRADGSFRHLSRTLLARSRLSGVPNIPASDTAEELSGEWLFAGIGRHHFGHFVVETLIRLWATGFYKGSLDGIVIVPKHDIDFASVLKRRFGAFLNMLTDDLPIHLVTKPTSFETLLLPSPGFGPNGWVAGTPVFREEIRTRVSEKIAPEGARKIYISRSKLAKEDKRVGAEEELEEVMRRAGYEIYHPEQHSILQQLAQYRAADTIVGNDGSAFHLAPFALPQGARVGLISRRDHGEAASAFSTQIASFAQADVTQIEMAGAMAQAAQATRTTRRATRDPSVINVAAVSDALSQANLI